MTVIVKCWTSPRLMRGSREEGEPEGLGGDGPEERISVMIVTNLLAKGDSKLKKVEIKNN